MAHWKNSNFQIKYFIAGNCHTADEAYRQLFQLWEDRDVAIRSAEASAMRAKAKLIRAQRVLSNQQCDEATKLEAEADIAEFNAFKDQSVSVLKQAMAERDYIKSLMDELEPHRKYKHLSLEEAFQATQEEEWFEELKWRAENFLATQGHIPHDHLATMRLHPAWEQQLLPYVNLIIEEQKQGRVSIPAHKTPIPALENKSNVE